jgi:hypothetical protein
MDRKILNIVNKVLSEELDGKIKKTKGNLFESDKMCSECGGMMKEGECSECGYMKEEMGEELHGNQKKLDKNKNGKIDSNDFKLLRRKKEMKEKLYGKQHKIDKNKNGKIDSEDFKLLRKEDTINEKWKGDVEVQKTGEHADKTIEQINSEIKKLKSKSENYKKEGKKVPSSNREKMAELYFAKRAKKDWPGKGKAKVEESKYSILIDGKKFIFEESEMVDIIENIVLEEKNKKTKRIPNVTKDSQLKSKKENDDYIESVVKKMKDYLKDGSKGEYEMKPKHFPKGNGELGEMGKRAYIPSSAVEEYIENFTAAGLENIDYDDIKPNEKWVEDNLVGSSRTGNNPEWANAVETEVGERRNKIRKDNLLGKIKKKAYNKSPQPVNDEAGENADKASKILMKLESKEDKVVISDIEKMKKLIGYNQKTQ